MRQELAENRVRSSCTGYLNLGATLDIREKQWQSYQYEVGKCPWCHACEVGSGQRQGSLPLTEASRASGGWSALPPLPLSGSKMKCGVACGRDRATQGAETPSLFWGSPLAGSIIGVKKSKKGEREKEERELRTGTG